LGKKNGWEWKGNEGEKVGKGKRERRTGLLKT